MNQKEIIYFHRNKESNFRLGVECSNETAKKYSLYIGHEVEVEGDFNTETGKFFATKFGGVDLIKPVEI
jgi:hypothetical protein